MFSISELLNGYKKKEFSPVEITKKYIERAKKLRNLNAFISLTEDVAMEQAKIAEIKWKLGDAGCLEGIPFSYKDNIHTKGVVSTSGSKVDRKFVPDKNADIVRRLNQEGAIMIGKNNMHEFAFGITSNNPFYGPARNPWDTSLTPGGSSGGSAVAVAAGLSIASIGTDTGGSVRIPAASCGLVGLKPTFGLLSSKGITPISWSIDHPGPIARTVSDLTLVMEALTEGDITLDDVQRTELKGIKIGVPTNYFTEQVEESIIKNYNKALKNLEVLGAEIVEVEIPDAEQAKSLTFTLAVSEGGYTHMDRKKFIDQYGLDVGQVIRSSESVRAIDYIHALKRKSELSAKLELLFEEIDIIVTPSVPAMPKPIGQEEVIFDDVSEPIFDCMIRFTSYFNLTGHPAISLPVGISNGLPVGVQLVSGKNKEEKLLSISKVYENHYLDDIYNTRQSKIEAYQYNV